MSRTNQNPFDRRAREGVLTARDRRDRIRNQEDTHNIKNVLTKDGHIEYTEQELIQKHSR